MLSRKSASGAPVFHGPVKNLETTRIPAAENNLGRHSGCAGKEYRKNPYSILYARGSVLSTSVLKNNATKNSGFKLRSDLVNVGLPPPLVHQMRARDM